MRPRFVDNQSGFAMLMVLAVLLMATIVGMQMLGNSMDDVTVSGSSRNSTKAFYSADAGLAIAKARLWNDYVESASVTPPKKAGEIGDRTTYTNYLNNIGLTNGSRLSMAADVDLGSHQYVDSVMVKRNDVASSTRLEISSTGHAESGAAQTIDATYRVEGAPFNGFDFAILAKNVNCIMCHATIDNVDRVNNTVVGKRGTFDRVKVAALESMLIRTTSAMSTIAGTVYTRGIVTDKAGVVITNLSPTGQGLNGYEMTADGKIVEPMNSTDLVNTTGTPLPQFGNLYLNYPTNEADMTDGALPGSFPPPFPDDNGNKNVDDDEYSGIASKTTGGITGGIIYAVPTGSTYASGSLPSFGNISSVNQSYEGNLILVGTDANPVEINGDFAVNGDVIVQGKVKGSGQIFARGNVYVTGNITYADGSAAGKRTFGVASDGTQNALSVAAGKNILVGDYLTPKNGSILDKTVIDPGNLAGGEPFSFTMSEMTLFNRAEWTKTQEFLPNKTGAMVANATYDATYKPRYYTLNSTDPVYIFNKNNSQNKGTYWDPVSNSWQGKEHLDSYDLTFLSRIDKGSPLLGNAEILPLSSSSNWITSQNLKSMWINDENSRSSGNPFQIDGQLYTNNSIFTLTRSASKTGGTMTVNGALVASDVGVLTPYGLQLNYDQRLRSYLKIKDNSKVEITQVFWYSR